MRRFRLNFEPIYNFLIIVDLTVFIIFYAEHKRVDSIDSIKVTVSSVSLCFFDNHNLTHTAHRLAAILLFACHKLSRNLAGSLQETCRKVVIQQLLQATESLQQGGT